MRPWTVYEVEFMNNNPRLTASQLAVMLHRTRSSVLRKKSRLRYPQSHRKAGALPGEQHPRALLTDDKVREIRARYEEGKAQANGERGVMSIGILVDEYNHVIAHSTMWSIIARKTWKHV